MARRKRIQMVDIQEPIKKDSFPEISITSKPNVKPAKTKKPDQSILNKPAPEQGISLRESWNGRIKR